MVKCLIRITTRVNVHLRMINHCYRDVKVRVLSLGPRMLGKALGVLPLYPALMGQQESAGVSPLHGAPLPCVQPSNPPGKLITEAAGVGVIWRQWILLFVISSRLIGGDKKRWIQFLRLCFLLLGCCRFWMNFLLTPCLLKSFH